MIDHLRIHVLWADGSVESQGIAEMISAHFDGLGMERDGVAYRVPVRFSSAPWAPGPTLPKSIDLTRADHNAVVVLNDDFMHEQAAAWDDYLVATRGSIDARGGVDIYIPFGALGREPVPASDAARHTQYVCRDGWTGLTTPGARDKRLLLHVLVEIRRYLRTLNTDQRDEPLFVSHAKADGDTTARAIITYVQSPDNDVPLDTFYDAMELNPGEDFQERFKQEIGRGTLIAIVSDMYDSRPWCVFELTTAKRHRRPIVLADINNARISRTFPYGANLPRVRLTPTAGDDAWIDPLLVEAMSEGLRCDIFEAQARKALAGADALILPRPPELFDVVDGDPPPHMFLYPDPPLGDIEAALVQRAIAAIAPGAKLLTLSEYSA
jgi:hypothetical protein